MKEFSQEEIELIEKVLHNEASQEERSMFDQKISTEPEFNAQVKLLKNIQKNFPIKSNEFESLLEDIHEEMNQGVESPVIKSSKPVMRYLYMAASLAIILISFFIIRNMTTSPLNEQLFANNFTIPPENITTRNDQGIDGDLINAISAYTAANYQQAIVFFEQYLLKNPNDPGANFYKGVAHLAADQPASALIHLKNITESDDSIYYNTGLWYLGLAYLQLNRLDEAELIFDQISKSNSSYKSQAVLLLEQLE